MHVTKREMWIIGGAVVLVAVAVFVGYALRGGGSGSNQLTGSGSGANDLTPTNPSSSSSGIPMVTAVPANTVVPNKGATTTPSNVAVPAVQSPGNPSGSVSYRSFNINIENGTYSPSTVIVKQGDIVNLRLTAVDANYGFTLPGSYGFNLQIPQGKTQTVQLQASQTGDFLFYCASCGGPSKGPTGHLIVTAN
jgi:heme/copper-type cytochrome/quinol oxidase subunit 2